MRKLGYSDYESLSRAAAERIVELARAKPDLKMCLATGSSPTRTYELFAEMAGRLSLRTDLIQVIKLDEWGGLPENHPASCEFYIRKYFNDPLSVDESRYLAFRADAPNREEECARVRNALSEIAPIDLCILGLGLNGHLGFNEPAEFLQAYAHIATLTQESQQHSMVAGAEEKPTFGYTLGMAELLQSKAIMLLVSGAKKKTQLDRLLSKRIDPQFPASFLWLHPNVDLFCDID